MDRPHQAGGGFLPPPPLEREEALLAPYAMPTRRSRGRQYPEQEHPYRTAYQRDRDRIIHSTAFRRLMYKTQVLVNHYSDHHRTRLTHTLEVAQLSRTIARQLGLNEDLTEAMALAHDLGHPPFGHAGENALAECMAAHGGFEHNRHGLRLVDVLEYRYPQFPGLNLTWEVRESLAYHSKAPAAPEVAALRAFGQPLLEAQLVDAVDSLAYDTHDVDDALSVGLLRLEDLREVEFCRRAQERVERQYGKLAEVYLQPALVRNMIDWQVNDLLEHTRNRLDGQRVGSVEEVRQAPGPLVGPGSELQALKLDLEEFLHRRVYRHYRVLRMAAKASRFITALFQEYVQAPERMPDKYRPRLEAFGTPRAVCDYLAGMTDRFAQAEYRGLFQPDENV